jgi:hypothetical protein
MRMFDDEDAAEPAMVQRNGAGGGATPSSSDTDSDRNGASDATESGVDSEDGGSAEQRGGEGCAVEYIFNSKAVVPSSRHTKRPGPVAGPAPGREHGRPSADEKQERRRFMSHKTAVVSSSKPAREEGGRRGAGGGKGGAKAAGEGDGMSRAEFQTMQREVQLYGEELGAVWFLCVCTARAAAHTNRGSRGRHQLRATEAAAPPCGSSPCRRSFS